MNIIEFKQQCKSCGKKVNKLQDGHCFDCILFFKEQWHVEYYGEANNQKVGLATCPLKAAVAVEKAK